MCYEAMVLICYLKKYALAILYKVTSLVQFKPLPPSSRYQRVMTNAH